MIEKPDWCGFEGWPCYAAAHVYHGNRNSIELEKTCKYCTTNKRRGQESPPDPPEDVWNWRTTLHRYGLGD